ncbi:MutS protein 5 [Fasciolopsis buskii]|uniref:MutS protein 5 n=1 Tax=Fasciolopsis buskii TaxID=27845 RepID=A0A8E0RU86_9TREM|nr:MutS protein 5 [Fasciolopsis buski]
MRTPLRDDKKINERLDAVQFLTRPDSNQLLKNMRTYLRLVCNVPQIFSRMQQASALPSHWKALLQALSAIEKLICLCLPYPTKLYPVRNLLNERVQMDILRKVQTWIVCIVDFEAISKQNRFSVRPGTDSTLDEWKQTYRCLPDLLSQLAEEELKKLRENISTCGLIYFPLVGYLLKIPKAEVTTPDISSSDLEFAFTDAEMAYYRNETTRELDKRYGDVMYSIIDSETTIMNRLQDRILKHCKDLLRMYEFAIEIDCLYAYAMAAIAMNGIRPEIVKDSVIRIKNGWHPVQQLLCGNMVRNSFDSDLDNSRVTVITGPNASGKSVYSKQVCLIVYLAQIGSFVPAEEAVIGLVDGIYTLTSAESSISNGHSSFAISLNLASMAIRNATKNTLILFDEFAHCLEEHEVTALTVAIVEYFLDLHGCPHLIICTHNFDILDFLKERNRVNFLTMKTITHAGKLTYLYEIKSGVTRNSHAIEVARSAGLPKAVVERAKQLLESSDHKRVNDLLAEFNKLDLDKVTPQLMDFLSSLDELFF